MSRILLSTLARQASGRTARLTNTRFLSSVSKPQFQRIAIISNGARSLDITSSRCSFSTSPAPSKGLSPESENPPAPEAEPHAPAKAPAELSKEEYDQISDAYMDHLLAKMEALAEEQPDVDVEYSAGVLNFTHPNGTYVINKQPPNKQIWLSSPISGPKRYDFVLTSEGQDAKEGTGSGEWVYMRDGSTLSGLLNEEIGVVLEDEFAGEA